MKDNSLTMSLMEMEYKQKQANINIKDNLKIVLNMVREKLFGLMVIVMMECGKTDYLMVKVI